VSDEIRDLVLEAQRRCNELRVRLIRGELSDSEAIPEYAKATAPLAKAAKCLAETERLRDALRQIQRELGVPDETYPAPVANAYQIAQEALP
jgi:hypothetical protein